jgi:citrate lyase beta subunit
VSNTSIPDADRDRILAALIEPNKRASARYPGASEAVQPVHTVYGGAHLFTSDIVESLGKAARKILATYAPDPSSLARALGWPEPLTARVYPRLVEKLERQPVEDFRIDFEDGFGNRPDEEEDHYAVAAAKEVATGLMARRLPPSIGLRIKTFSEELKARSLRTLDLFVTTLLDQSKGELPPRFFITLPKITASGQVAALAAACDAMERGNGLARGTLKIELMVETPQTIFAADGSVALPRLIAEGEGRVTGAHFGTYDYTASLSITAAHQHMAHPVCDFAKRVMQVSLAGLPVQMSDGATNVMPIGPHRAAEGEALTAEQIAENADVVHRAWRLHSEHIRHSLVGGFYQGWDLHPAQLPTRFATVFAFFLEGVAPASERLKNFVAKAAQATLVGDVFDDAATGQGLLNYFLRAMNCGALGEQEAVALSGLTLDELRSRSFLKILNGRRARPSPR